MQGMTVARPYPLSALSRALKRSPVTALLGPRQCGKTTLARKLPTAAATWFDLERPADLARLAEPMLALERLRGLVVLDEVQRRPDIFPVLRVLADRKPLPARFLVLGSAAPELLQQASESLAGRIELVYLGGLSLDEVGARHWRKLWVRGAFPRAFLARSEADSVRWREDFVQTFLERDLGQLGVRVPAATMRRFWTMVANQSAEIWNSSSIGAAMGEAHTTAARRLDALESALVVRRLRPWFANIGKRLVKSPKVYMRDTGLLHALLGIPGIDALEGHPKKGASWETFAVEQILGVTGDRDAYYWRTQAGAELDLLVFRGGKRLGFEIKYGDAPRFTPSMRAAQKDLALDRLFLVTPAIESAPIAPGVEAASIAHCMAELRQTR